MCDRVCLHMTVFSQIPPSVDQLNATAPVSATDLPTSTQTAHPLSKWSQFICRSSRWGQSGVHWHSFTSSKPCSQFLQFQPPTDISPWHLNAFFSHGTSPLKTLHYHPKILTPAPEQMWCHAPENVYTLTSSDRVHSHSLSYLFVQEIIFFFKTAREMSGRRPV